MSHHLEVSTTRWLSAPPIYIITIHAHVTDHSLATRTYYYVPPSTRNRAERNVTDPHRAKALSSALATYDTEKRT